MDSIVSSEHSAFLKTAVRAAVEAAVLAIVAALIAGHIWNVPVESRAITIGTAAAWAASSASVIWLLWVRGRAMRIFWWAFGGGMVLRAAVLGALAVWGYGRTTVKFEVLLISYVFALLALLLTLEMRHLKIR